MKAAFLDRDGVLNVKPPDIYYVTRLEDFRLLPGAAEGIAALNRAGYSVMIATNQQAVAKGLLTLDGLAEMHRRLEAEAVRAGGRIERIYFCPHAQGTCDCRKPKPGMLTTAFRDYPEIDKAASFFVGDADSDRIAAEAAGLRFIPLETNGNLYAGLKSAGIVR